MWSAKLSSSPGYSASLPNPIRSFDSFAAVRIGSPKTSQRNRAYPQSFATSGVCPITAPPVATSALAGARLLHRLSGNRMGAPDVHKMRLDR
jgi:hypothetical protein